MTLLHLHDADGDPVVIDASAIVALWLGPVQVPIVVTKVLTLGGVLAVREPLADVLAQWEASRGATATPSAFTAEARGGFTWVHPALSGGHGP